MAPNSFIESKRMYTRYAGWPSWRVLPRMADRDRELVVRNALAPMAEKGFPWPPVILVLLSQNYPPPPLLKFRGQDKTFSCLLCVDWTNIYHTAVKRLVCSHRLQCFTVLPISVRSYDCTIKIWQTRILSIWCTH